MKTLTISYSGIKHKDRAYEENIISAFEALGFEYDGCDLSFDEHMTRGLFFIVPENQKDINIEVDVFDEDTDEVL